MNSFLPQVRVFSGKTAILAHASVLEAFAERCNQPRSLHWLSYFLNGTGRFWKYPRLVLVFQDGANPDNVQAHSLLGAALFLEYQVLGWKTGISLCEDAVAWDGRHSYISAIVADAMLKRGSHVACVSYQWAASDPNRPARFLVRPDILWAHRSREIRRQIELGSTYEETLSRFGHKTRANLRYYRKRFAAVVEVSFVADARQLLSQDDLLLINSNCLNPVSRAECRLRHQVSTSLPNSFLAGLRDRNGRWLSAMGGWRVGGVTVLYWQANLAGFEKHSLGTVMRAYFFEGEVARGSTTFMIHGGTSHSMQNSFKEEVFWDLIVLRTTLRAKIYRSIARLAAALHLPGRSNFLAAALRNKDVRWHTSADDHPSAQIAGEDAAE